MNKKVILVALIISVCVILLLRNQMQVNEQQNSKANAKPVEILKKKVVVCKKRLAARTRLEESTIKDSFELRELIASSVPEDAFTDVASLTNKYTSVTVLPNDIITPIRLMEDGTIPNLARAIPAGKRAVSITVSKASSVGGFIEQGDYVDVIATFRPRNGETISKIVLQDIQVLAMGNTYEFEGAISTSTPAIAANKAELITLALTPEDLEKLMYLDAGTTFRLVLKNPADKDTVVQTKGATEQILISTKETSNENVQMTQNVSSTHTHVEEEEIDDGRVEILFGSNKKRDIYRYNGPAYKKNYNSAINNSRIPSAEILNPSEEY